MVAASKPTSRRSTLRQSKTLKRQGRLEMERQGKNPAPGPGAGNSAASETFGHGAKSQYMVNEEIRKLLKISRRTPARI